MVIFHSYLNVYQRISFIGIETHPGEIFLFQMLIQMFQRWITLLKPLGWTSKQIHVESLNAFSHLDFPTLMKKTNKSSASFRGNSSLSRSLGHYSHVMIIILLIDLPLKMDKSCGKPRDQPSVYRWLVKREGVDISVYGNIPLQLVIYPMKFSVKCTMKLMKPSFSLLKFPIYQ